MAPQSEGPSWENDPLWYKDAIIYELHVKAFFDHNNDGTGDFRGLTDKLEYIHDLGVNTVWLLPFYPSPMRDDGYDVADYRNVHPDYGSLKDFRAFVRKAHSLGLKVITELIINHTSDQHAWFKLARQSPPHSARRNYYIWSENDKKFPETRIIFTDAESSNWAWDPVARAYYWHRFFSHQPDLNHNNPQVVKAVVREMRFWLDMGVDGLRLDAIPYLCVRDGTINENLPETHAVIKEMRAVVDAHYKNRMFLAEANQWPEDVRDYFGSGDECHMAYHFPLMPRMYMALAQEDRHPIVEIMQQTPEIPETCQWAVFLRNHDELTLEMVTDRERDYMYEIYASDPRMRLNVGIRRRLGPLMDNDPERIKLLNSLLFSMPGSPIIYYGDEIGMGDNFFLGDRNGVRTPMQWSPDRNAGFSKADPQRLYLPPVMDPIYGFNAVNVEAQSRDLSSLLNWMKRMMAVRKTYKAFSRGSLTFLSPGNRKILAYIRHYRNDNILCVCNLSRSPQPVELDLSRFKGNVPLEMLGHTPFPPIGDLPYLLTLSGYGVYWFRLSKEAEVPAWHEERLPAIELPLLVLFEGLRSFFPHKVEHGRYAAAERLRIQMEQEILPAFMRAQRWFAAKAEHIERVELLEPLLWSEDATTAWLLSGARVYIAEAPSQVYFLPLAIIWEDDEDATRAVLHYTVARVRQRARLGVLCDAFADERYCMALVKAMAKGLQVPYGAGHLRFTPTAVFADVVGDAHSPLVMRHPRAEGSNTALILGDKLFLKGYRRLRQGVNPELEIGRFLTEVAHFPNIIPVAGAMEYIPEHGECVTLALLQAYVDNQGDVWSYALDYLHHFLEESLAKPGEKVTMTGEAAHAAFKVLMRTLGRRTAEMHRALAQTTGNPDFDPEPITQADIRAWVEQVRGEAASALHSLAQRHDLPSAVAVDAEKVAALQGPLMERLTALLDADIQAVKSRHHGDLHLGQILLVENDFVFIDFEGEPARPLAERRAKHSALRDVAGLLRSFNYAAYAAVFRIISELPEVTAAVEPLARDWERLAALNFLSGYEKNIAGSPVYPQNPDHAWALLELFTLEKAFYELRYELDNRPDWVAIPLKGILGLFELGVAKMARDGGEEQDDL